MDKQMKRRALLGSCAVATAFLANPTRVLARQDSSFPGGWTRSDRARDLRIDAARYWFERGVTKPRANGDEARYATKIGSFSKTLQHDGLGQVYPASYDSLLQAIESGNEAEFETILMGGSAKLVDPLAGDCFVLEGPDSRQVVCPPPPRLNSLRMAGEIAEDYWMAVARDVSFTEYETDPLISEAAADLDRFTTSSLPRVEGHVAAASVFRGITPGDLTGPYISQFLHQPVPYGDFPAALPQRYRTILAGEDRMTSFAPWLAVQNGVAVDAAVQVDGQDRFLRNGRDLAEYVHRDFSFMAFLNAALVLLGYGSAALNPTNPYLRSKTQSGFATFGAPAILDLVARAGNASLTAAWYSKWGVHRRVRPEEVGGTIHNQLAGAGTSPLSGELFRSPVLAKVAARYGSFLLPQAYPEGCPAHPSYPGGHSCIAGACVTILKALFNESYAWSNPLVASADGLTLTPYAGTLTVGGELNKLASNISLGRDFAGVHWRSDGIEGMRQGEDVAIGLLRDLRSTFAEPSAVFQFTRFDGTQVTIRDT